MVEDFYKTRIAAPVADVDMFVIVATADKQGIGAADPAVICIINEFS